MSSDSPRNPSRRQSRRPADGHNLNRELPSVDALLSHPATEHRSLRDLPASKRKEKLVEELLDMQQLPHEESEEPDEAARFRALWSAFRAASEKVAEQIRTSRQKRRVALARAEQVLRQQYSEHDVDKLVRLIKEEPGLAQYLQQRGEAAVLLRVFALSLWDRGSRWEPTDREIMNFVDRAAEGKSSRTADGASRYAAHRMLAKMLGPGWNANRIRTADKRAIKKYRPTAKSK